MKPPLCKGYGGGYAFSYPFSGGGGAVATIPGVGRGSLLFLLGGLSVEGNTLGVFSGEPRVRSVVLSLFANGVELWFSPLVGSASGLPGLRPAIADPCFGLLALVCNCGFLLPLSAARDGRCRFKGIRCVAADGRRRWLLWDVQGWKSLVLLGGRFGSDSGVFHQRRSSDRKKKLGTCFGGFDVIFSFVKVLSVQLGMYCASL